MQLPDHGNISKDQKSVVSQVLDDLWRHCLFLKVGVLIAWIQMKVPEGEVIFSHLDLEFILPAMWMASFSQTAPESIHSSPFSLLPQSWTTAPAYFLLTPNLHPIHSCLPLIHNSPSARVTVLLEIHFWLCILLSIKSKFFILTYKVLRDLHPSSISCPTLCSSPLLTGFLFGSLTSQAHSHFEAFALTWKGLSASPNGWPPLVI